MSEPRPPGKVLFEGRVLEGQDVASDETVWTVQAVRVFRGDVTTVQPVVTHPLEASCGLRVAVGESYLISATPYGRPGVLGTGLCSDIQQIAGMTLEERRTLEQLLGPGQLPRAALPAPVPEPPRDPLAIVLVSALAAGMAAVLGALLVWRRRRRTP